MPLCGLVKMEFSCWISLESDYFLMCEPRVLFKEVCLEVGRTNFAFDNSWHRQRRAVFDLQSLVKAINLNFKPSLQNALPPLAMLILKAL